MANQCGNGNYLGQPAWGPATKSMAWYSYLWVALSYRMSGSSPLPLRLDKSQKRQLRNDVRIALGVLILITFVILALAYGQTAIRGY